MKTISGHKTSECAFHAGIFYHTLRLEKALRRRPRPSDVRLCDFRLHFEISTSTPPPRLEIVFEAISHAKRQQRKLVISGSFYRNWQTGESNCRVSRPNRKRGKSSLAFPRLNDDEQSQHQNVRQRKKKYLCKRRRLYTA